MDSLVFYTWTDFEPITATLNLGSIAARSSDDLMLQVVNGSDTYQARDVSVTVSGADAQQLYLSLDGDDFAASIEVGSIAPGSGCTPFWLRRVTPSTFTGAATATLSATPTEWTHPVDVTASTNVALGTDVELDDLSLHDPLIPTED